MPFAVESCEPLHPTLYTCNIQCDAKNVGHIDKSAVIQPQSSADHYGHLIPVPKS